MNCASLKDLLPLLSSGDLSDDASASLNAHLTACAACRAEKEALDTVRRLLDEVPTTSATVDLAQIYREADALHRRSARRWRRLALASLATAAALLMVVFLLSLEWRVEGHQLTLRWGSVPQIPPPAPAPEPSPSPEVDEQLRLLGELVQLIAKDADRRQGVQGREVDGLRVEVEMLRRQMAQLRMTMGKDVAALYAAQFSDVKKGDPQ